MARLLLLLAARAALPLLPPPPLVSAIRPPPPRVPAIWGALPPSLPSFPSRGRGPTRPYATSSRGHRKRSPARSRRRKRPVELEVQIGIEEELPEDPEILSIAETLQTDVGKAMKVAFDTLKDSNYKTRDSSINDVDKYEKVEVSLLLCNDDFIRKLNKEWRDEDHATDVLSMSQHVPELDLPFLLLGDIVISVETAARQAEEGGHALLDEIRVLMVHGLLHLLGFDHEISNEAEEEMEKEEEYILNILEWKGKGLIKTAHEVAKSKDLPSENFDAANEDTKKTRILSAEPKLSYIICDIDSTFLDGKGQLRPKSAEALREAISKGTKVIMATGRSRPAIIRSFKLLDLGGKDDVVSETSPGVFLQGSLVYGRQGQEIYRANLDLDICREAILYSLKHKVPLVAYCEDQCFTLFEHPFVDLLHTTYHEPKAKVVPSIEHLLTHSSVQKLVFHDNCDGAPSILRPYLSEATKGQAHVLQMQPDALEIVPFGTSKSGGVRILLDHLGIAAHLDVDPDVIKWWGHPV